MLIGWLLRCLPLAFGWFSFPLDYDEGVHYAAAALWWHGVLPYHDYVFVHPPGLLLAQLPVVCWDPDPATGLQLARWGVTLVGAVNLCLIWALARRCWGPTAAVGAVLCYAIYPEVVESERRLLIEPLLNTCVLCFLLYSRWSRAALWAGLGLSLKAWGALWIAARCLAVPWREFRSSLKFGLMAVAWTALICSLVAGDDVRAFFRETVLFHLHRPPSQAWNLAERLGDVFQLGHLPITLLACLGWLDRSRARDPVGTTLSYGWGLLLVALLLAPVHFNQYNTHLALPECFWAGHGLRRLAANWRWALVTLAIPLGFSLSGWLDYDATAVERAETIVRAVRPNEMVFSFEPGDLLLAGRLPPYTGPAPVVVDTYGTMLLDTEGRYALADLAFADPSSQKRVKWRLLLCDWVVVEQRARRQLSSESWRWFRQRFRPAAGDLWRRR